eukprot:NODE_3238_length_1004_cov_22.790194_g3092_i0.p1 GENE.NODE_3238_length_1004_cov_22.790194_g3092_i0~~NODE_3238_length_1004_cov_22.790194_g3092_i0.p1  ORF type:complete len:274 (-),score=62.25 NODE_3238_length_1004_cov_22.790194_g3092_i0:107-928(-)
MFLRSLLALRCTAPHMSHTLNYGHQHPSQFLHLHFPDPCPPACPVVMLLHGGWWKAKYNLLNTPITTLIPEFLARGYAVVNTEYRHCEQPEGGYPGTQEDALQAWAYTHTTLPNQFPSVQPQLGSVVCGHSAGGCLALMVAALSEHTPSVCIPISPLTDMKEGFLRKLSDEGDAVLKYMKHTYDAAPEAYHLASPSHHMPLKCNTILVSSDGDVDVPIDLVAAFHKQAQAQTSPLHECVLINGGAEDHLACCTSGSQAFNAAMDSLQRLGPKF